MTTRLSEGLDPGGTELLRSVRVPRPGEPGPKLAQGSHELHGPRG